MAHRQAAGGRQEEGTEEERTRQEMKVRDVLGDAERHWKVWFDTSVKC